MKLDAEQQVLSFPDYPNRAAWWLTLFGMALALSLLVLGAEMLIGARQDAWDQAEQASTNLAVALERDISRNLTIYDLAIQGAIDGMRQPGLASVSPEIRQAALFDRAASADYMGSLRILNAAGDVIADSGTLTPPSLNLAKSDFFQVHRHRADAGLFISLPFQSLGDTNENCIAFSRRVTGPDGRFAGVVVGTLRLTYLQDMFARLQLGVNGAVALSRADGWLLARRPAISPGFVRVQAGGDVFSHYEQAHAGEFLSKSVLDGITRLTVYRQIGALPLLITVAVSTESIYAVWWHKAIVIGSILSALCAATVTLSLLFRKEMLRRVSAEKALFEAASKLSIVAATDALTGLSNRRAFEAALADAWRRSVRAETPVALLMLDADWFKAFNDRYGHQEGDAVLRAVARSIEASLRRPGDLGARYGGEEFVVLLPGTDLTGASNTAERICLAVRDMNIAHEGSPVGHVTLSVGGAVTYPAVGTDSAAEMVELIKAADTALYDAKRSGRNRVEMAQDSLSADAAGKAVVQRTLLVPSR